MTKFNLLKNMMKEEWRIHSTLFGNLRFGLFPFVIIIFGFIGSLGISLFGILFSKISMIIFTHYLFMFLGANVGAFGLIGKEFMNRRFGQASLIAYSSRTLPISERIIFFNMMIKDILYYFLLWIIPLITGFAIASPILKMDFSYVFLFLLTLSLSFLIGVSLVFFLSMLYSHSGKIFISSLLLISFLCIYFIKDFITIFPPLAYFLNKDIIQIWLSLFLIFIPSFFAILFISFDFPTKKNYFDNSLKKIKKLFSYTGKYSNYISKDFIDLKRSEGGLGKIFFSYLIPLSFIWVFITFFMKFILKNNIADFNFIILFAIFLGVFSSTMYTWLTEYDLFNQYLFLPVKVSTIIKSKILSYILLNIISLAILLTVSIIKNDFSNLLLSFIIFIIISFFSLSITIYHAGLSPAIMLMDAKVLIQYFMTIIPSMLVLIASYFFGIIYLILTLSIILLISYFIFIKALDKWDNIPQQTF